LDKKKKKTVPKNKKLPPFICQETRGEGGDKNFGGGRGPNHRKGCQGKENNVVRNSLEEIGVNRKGSPRRCGKEGAKGSIRKKDPHPQVKSKKETNVFNSSPII